MRLQNRGWMILALFFCSGATALVYEVVWSKFLSQMLGSTVYAQTVVLASFMGGLAIGNRVFGRWADRMQQPVRAYGCLEIAIGIYALLFPALDWVANWMFVALGTPIAERAGLLLLLKGVLSTALLIGPTILMGGTLPLMAAWLQKSASEPGRRSARFYSVNSLGAVAGSAIAGFWLVQTFGLVTTLRVAAAGNLIVGALAILFSRRNPAERPTGPEKETSSKVEGVSAQTLRWAGLIVALSGGVSMGLELLASRSLVLVFGSSVQSFAVVLIAFILGIGLGSAWIASPRRQWSARMVVVLLCIAAVWVALLVLNVERLVDYYRVARTGLARTSVGYLFHLLVTVGFSLAVLGLPAACIGAVLPLMIRAVSREGAPLGTKVGVLLTWNTLGAVAGTLFTGFVLMPRAGLRDAFATLALVLGVVALVLARQQRWRMGIAGTAGVCLLTGCLFVGSDEGWKKVMSSGVFRARETEFIPSLARLRKSHIKLLFYEDAPDATVTVRQGDGVGAPPDISLCINGKPDASTRGDLSSQMLCAHLPMLSKPGAKDVFVLGLGSGVTASVMLGYPVDQIVVAENCEPVIRASKIFAGWNRHVVGNPRVRLWNEDARTVLKLRPQMYDVIIAEPSNPWTVGVGSVFSREFYDLAVSRLKPGGIMSQWFHVYEMSDAVLSLVLRTFSSAFPFVEFWETSGGDIVMLGSLQPWESGPDVFQQGFNLERVRTDMEMIDIRSPEALMARQIASQRTGFAIAGKGPIQSDLFPVLEYAAPRAFYIGEGTRMMDRFDERTRQQLLAPAWKRDVLKLLPLVSAQIVFSTYMSMNDELAGCLYGTSHGDVPCVFQTERPTPAPASDGSFISGATRAFEAGNLDEASKLAALAMQQNPDDQQAGYVARVIEREKKSRQAVASTTVAQ